MKTLKKLTTIVLILLLIAIIASLLMGGFMPFLSIAFGFLFIYYVLLYLVVKILENKQRYKYVVWLLFILPILWAFIDLDNFINFLLQGIHLDMK